MSDSYEPIIITEIGSKTHNNPKAVLFHFDKIIKSTRVQEYLKN